MMKFVVVAGLLSLCGAVSSSFAAQSASAARMEQRLIQGAKQLRSSQGRKLLLFADRYQGKIEKDSHEAQNELKVMQQQLDEMKEQEWEPSISFMKLFKKVKREASIAEEAHKMMDADTDNMYQMLAKYPEEIKMDPKTVAFDNTVDAEFEELLHDPKMQSMMQMSEENVAPSAMLQVESMAATHMSAVAITAEGRVGKTGVDEEGTEEQGAAMAEELLKMFDSHLGHYGSAPTTLSSFIETHDSLDDKQRIEAQEKALLQRRVSKAMSKSAQIDKLLDDAIMEYLEDPKLIELKPTILEEIAGAFRGNNEPLLGFSDHPFMVRYRNEQASNALMPPKAVQRELLDHLFKSAPSNMKMAVIHADLNAPGSRELKIRQDLLCMKKTLKNMVSSDLEAAGQAGDLRIFVDVTGGKHEKHRESVLKEITQGLEPIHKVLHLNDLGNQEVQDYAMGLADFVYRVGEGELSGSHNLDLAQFKTEALRRGGIIKADPSRTPDKMCTLDNEDLDSATSKAFEKFSKINLMVEKVQTQKKEKELLSETEQWAAQQRKVEKTKKHHGKADVSVDFKPVMFGSKIVGTLKGFSNFMLTRDTQQGRIAAHSADRHEKPKERRSANYGLYVPRSRRMV